MTVAIFGGLPGLYLMWAAYRDDRAEALVGITQMGLSEVADELAVTVRAQWAAEASARRLDDPILLVRWEAADKGVAEQWRSLEELATTGAGWAVPSPTRSWAPDATALAGAGGDIAGILTRIPTRRLVVLGGPGAGKTMLLVRMVLDLLVSRKPGEPVPILVSLSTWSPADQDLREWLAAQMTVDYPALGARPPGGSAGTNRAEALLRRPETR